MLLRILKAKPVSRRFGMTVAEIVSDYILQYRLQAREEMQYFENEPSPSAAIRRAALCE